VHRLLGKSLEALKQLGLVDEVSTVSEVKRFDANHLSHHHLVCVRCDKVIDYYDHGFDALPIPQRLPGFIAQSLMVHIKGLCDACAG
jgi:Fur family peroxide stress response transcriptional regulator